MAARPGRPSVIPLRFALDNLLLSDGLVALTDVPKGMARTLSPLQLNLPFWSQLDTKREILVSPKLAFALNAIRFDCSAQALPFEQTRQTDVRLSFKDFDLAPSLRYLSASLLVKLAVALLADRNGVIDLDLPIGGSLNDPALRLLPIVFKVIGSLIVTAITAPVKVSDPAYPALCQVVDRCGDFPKPRKLVGLTRRSGA